MAAKPQECSKVLSSQHYAPTGPNRAEQHCFAGLSQGHFPGNRPQRIPPIPHRATPPPQRLKMPTGGFCIFRRAACATMWARACSYKLSMKIFEGISARFKAKICRRTGVLQKFLTRKMTEIHQKDSCERLCEHALRSCLKNLPLMHRIAKRGKTEKQVKKFQKQGRRQTGGPARTERAEKGSAQIEEETNPIAFGCLDDLPAWRNSLSRDEECG